uniref:TBC1 domain family member 23 n=1 Tax=Mesocestoides corti TaxID=53468 RepID=A0A5K3FQV9_MESCO
MASISSNSSLDELSTDDSWETELEIALLENAGLMKVRSICHFRPVPSRLRRDLWRLCLRVETNSSRMSDFTEIFDLQTQEQLHSACEVAATAILSSGGSETTCNLPTVLQLTSEFESVLTHFSHTYSLEFAPDNGWVSILSNLYTVLRPIDREELYAFFTSVYHRFIASGIEGSLRVCSAFRLLLQYHEPELCSFLDSHKLGPETYAKDWLNTLFAGHLTKEALLSMWDIYFLHGKPEFGIFVALVLLVNAKDRLMNKEIAEEAVEEAFCLDDGEEPDVAEKESVVVTPKSRDALLTELRDLPKPMQSSDLAALVEITQIYDRKTPFSFHTKYLPLIFGSPDPENDNYLINGALSLLVSVEEILSAQASRNEMTQQDEEAGAVRFLLVDCRPADQYNAGHLATAFYLDTELMLSNPPEFNTSVQALLQTQKRGIASGSKAVGEHIVFMGSGRLAEDRVANMVIAHFLRLNTAFVSMVYGGYTALHEALGPLEFNRRLVSHEADLCLVCATNRGEQAVRMARQQPLLSSTFHSSTPRGASIPPTAQPFDIVLSTFSNLLKKSTPSSRAPQIAPTPVSVVKPASYRNTAAVFSIDDNDDEDDENPDLVYRPISLPLAESTVKMKTNQRVFSNLRHCVAGQLIDFNDCRKMPEVNSSFICRLFSPNGSLSNRGILLLLEEDIVLVKEREKQLLESLGNFVQKTFHKKSNSASKNVSGSGGPERNTDGLIEFALPLVSLKKITSNKLIPEVITFHFSRATEDFVSETLEAVRLHIPEAGDAVKAIKLAVYRANGIGVTM